MELNYLAERREAELERARSASCAQSRRVHHELAERYAHEMARQKAPAAPLPA